MITGAHNLHFVSPNLGLCLLFQPSRPFIPIAKTLDPQSPARYAFGLRLIAPLAFCELDWAMPSETRGELTFLRMRQVIQPNLVRGAEISLAEISLSPVSTDAKGGPNLLATIFGIIMAIKRFHRSDEANLGAVEVGLQIVGNSDSANYYEYSKIRSKELAFMRQ